MPRAARLVAGAEPHDGKGRGVGRQDGLRVTDDLAREPWRPWGARSTSAARTEKKNAGSAFADRQAAFMRRAARSLS